MKDFYVDIQIVGTADDCIQQLGELQRLTGTDVVCGFSYGRMRPDKAGPTCACSRNGGCW